MSQILGPSLAVLLPGDTPRDLLGPRDDTCPTSGSRRTDRPNAGPVDAQTRLITPSAAEAL